MSDFSHESHDFLFRGPVFFGGDHVIEIGNADFFAAFLKQDVSEQLGIRLGFPPNRSMEVLYYNEDWVRELVCAMLPVPRAQITPPTAKTTASILAAGPSLSLKPRSM
jgi:hypothetical protein